MARNWITTGVSWIAVAVGLVIAFVAGLYIYVTVTARPLHPDPQAVRSVGLAVPSATWPAAIEKGRQIARTGVSTQNLPGLSVAVGVGGDVVWAEGFGYADIEKQTIVTPQTQFRIADVSIPLTSAAVGLLLEQKRLNLDHDIQAYVPEFPEKPWPVMLRQLMAHTAGVRNDAGNEEPLSEHCDRPADGLKRFANDPLRFEPGTRFRSSSYGWVLVSAAIESAAGEPFFTFMRTQIFEPLEMTGTRPDSAKDAIADRATFYFPRFGGDTRYGPELAREGDHSCLAGAAGFLSTPSDLVRFGMAFGRGRIVQPATVELLETPQLLSSGEQTEYGLGWKIDTVPLAGAPARMASHGTRPDFIGGTASLLTFPERGLVVAVTSNTGFANTRSIALEIAEAFAAHMKGPGPK